MIRIHLIIMIIKSQTKLSHPKISNQKNCVKISNQKTCVKIHEIICLRQLIFFVFSGRIHLFNRSL
jgi:hypothetical protein